VSEYRGFGVDEGQRFTSIGTIYVPLYADTPRRLRAVTFLPVPTPTLPHADPFLPSAVSAIECGHGAIGLSFDRLLFEIMAFVDGRLAASDAEFDFHPGVLPVEAERH
jgi:hypothetical protein